MEHLATKLTNYILSKESITKQSYEIYKYGFQIGLEIMLCVIISVIVSVRLHMLFECIIFYIVFIPLRSYAGGLHLDSFLSCFICSCLVLVSSLLLVANYQFEHNVALFIILWMAWWIKVLAPVKNINRYLDEKELCYFKTKLNKVLVKVVVFSVILYALKGRYYLSLIAIIMIVVVASMVLGRWKYIRNIKKLL